MTIIHVVSIKEVVSPHLTVSKTALDFFEKGLSNIVSTDLRIDFSEIKSINRSFAYQYLVSKHDCKKKVREINVLNNVYQVLKSVQEEIDDEVDRKKKNKDEKNVIIRKN